MSCFDTAKVIGCNLVPDPPAKIIPFIFYLNLTMKKTLIRQTRRQLNLALDNSQPLANPHSLQLRLKVLNASHHLKSFRPQKYSHHTTTQSVSMQCARIKVVRLTKRAIERFLNLTDRYDYLAPKDPAYRRTQQSTTSCE